MGMTWSPESLRPPPKITWESDYIYWVLGASCGHPPIILAKFHLSAILLAEVANESLHNQIFESLVLIHG